jgi:hypothetical protein
MSEVKTSFKGWANGVISSGRPERNPRTSATHGYNTILTNVNASGATPTTRPGLDHWNVVKTHNGALKSLTDYIVYDNNGDIDFTLLIGIGDDGKVWQIPKYGVGNPMELGSGFSTTNLTPPSTAVAKNLCFMVDSSARKKLWGINYWDFGIVRPSTTPTLGFGAAGIMTGTFEVVVTFVNTRTGHESSASDVSGSITLTNKILALSSIPTSSDPQVDARYIYIRNTSNQTLFRRAAILNDNSTTTLDINVDTELLINLAPSSVSNDPPPATIKHIAWHNSYMFVADEYNLYWSKQNEPESFDSTFIGEPVGTGDGQKITALFSYKDVLLVFKTRSVYVLQGSIPETWKLSPLFGDIGTTSAKSIIEAGGALWWWAEGATTGTVRWGGEDSPAPLGKLLLGDMFVGGMVNIAAGIDTVNNLVLFSHPGAGIADGHNRHLLVINYDRNIIASDKWDGFDVASMAQVTTSIDSAERVLMFGNYNGQVFQESTTAKLDAVGNNTTVQGSFVAASSGISSISGTGFYTVGDTNLVGRYVTITDSKDRLYAHKLITSSSATLITFDGTVDGLSVGATYNYYIGCPKMEWWTAAEDANDEFLNKKLLRHYISFSTVLNVVSESIHAEVFNDDYPFPKEVVNISTLAVDTNKIQNKSFGGGTVAQNWFYKICSYHPKVTLTILGLQTKCDTLGDQV